MQRLAQSIVDRIAGLGKGGPVMESVSESQSSQSQERNFDHSSSWFTNFDGWNVMHEGGHSSEQSSGSAVGQDKNFSGITTVPGEELQRELVAVFYPGQPLVSPKLVNMIKQAARGAGQ